MRESHGFAIKIACTDLGHRCPYRHQHAVVFDSVDRVGGALLGIRDSE